MSFSSFDTPTSALAAAGDDGGSEVGSMLRRVVAPFALERLQLTSASGASCVSAGFAPSPSGARALLLPHCDPSMVVEVLQWSHPLGGQEDTTTAAGSTSETPPMPADSGAVTTDAGEVLQVAATSTNEVVDDEAASACYKMLLKPLLGHCTEGPKKEQEEEESNVSSHVLLAGQRRGAPPDQVDAIEQQLMLRLEECSRNLAARVALKLRLLTELWAPAAASAVPPTTKSSS